MSLVRKVAVIIKKPSGNAILVPSKPSLASVQFIPVSSLCPANSFPERLWQLHSQRSGCCAPSPSHSPTQGWDRLTPSRVTSLVPPGAVSSLGQGLLHGHCTSQPHTAFCLGWNISRVTGDWGENQPQPSSWGHQTHRWIAADAPGHPAKPPVKEDAKASAALTSAHVPWIIGTETWLNTEIWKGRGKRSPGRRQKIMDTLSVVLFCAFHPTQSPIYSCGFSRNTNPKTRCTESSVHGIKASIHHVSSVSWLYSFCLLLSSDYNLLINNTLMIFSMPIYFLRHWLGFLRLLKKYKYLYKQISILKWSLTTYRCNMTSTKNQSIFGTWNPLLAMKVGVAEITPGKDPHSPFKKSIWINIRSSLGPWTSKTLQQVGEKPPEQQHRGTSTHQPDVQIQLYGTAAPQLIYSWTDERLEDLNSIHGHISRIKSDYTRTEKTANIFSQKTASSNSFILGYRFKVI